MCSETVFTVASTVAIVSRFSFSMVHVRLGCTYVPTYQKRSYILFIYLFFTYAYARTYNTHSVIRFVKSNQNARLFKENKSSLVCVHLLEISKYAPKIGCADGMGLIAPRNKILSTQSRRSIRLQRV